MREELEKLIADLRYPKPPHHGKCLKAANVIEAQENEHGRV